MASSAAANHCTRPHAWLLTVASILALAGCGNSHLPVYTISGTITGLTVTGLVLRNNGVDDLTPPANATSFQFATALQAGANYEVTVATQPAGLMCSVTKASGNNVREAVSNVTVACVSATLPIAGTITGLSAAGLILRNNGGDDLAVPAFATSFQFATQAEQDSGYLVSILAQPTGLTCTVNAGTGSHVTTAVSGVRITCSANTHSIAGTISGLTTGNLVLQNNSADNLIIAPNATTLQFAAPIAQGGVYNVTVFSQPAGLTCTVSNSAGTNVQADVSNVQVTCSATVFSIGGTISGLTAGGLVLQNNGGDGLSVAANSTGFGFATPVADGGTYAVTVLTQPAGQTCSVAGGSGVAAAQVSVALTCANIVTFTITTSSGANGSITPTGAVVVNEADDQGFVATPDAGYAVQQWLLDGTPVQSGGDVYTLTDIVANHALAVTFGQAGLSESVASLALSAGGVARRFTITNTGSVAAVNISIGYPTWPTGTTANSTCATTLNAADTCTITITPGATPSAAPGDTAPAPLTLTVSGDNTNTLTPTINIVTYGSVYQSGYVFAIDDTMPMTGSIGGKVVSLADQVIAFSPGIIWSANGSGTYDGGTPIYGISSSSTTSSPNPNTGQVFGQSACNGNFDGACNTANIIDYYSPPNTNPAINGSYYAAGLSSATIDGYSDWYLPAICEIDNGSGAGCSNAESIVSTLPSLIGNSNTDCVYGANCMAGYYWSSTEYTGNPRSAAWYEFLAPSGGNDQSIAGKTNPLGIRSVRRLEQ